MSKSLRAEASELDDAQALVRFYVAEGHGGGWLIFREGDPKPIHKLQGKLLAIETAKIMARAESPSQVMVEQRDGSFATKFDFDHNTEQRGY